MADTLNLRINDSDEARLREIAGNVGAIGRQGYGYDKPSISRLLTMIASGELVVMREGRTTVRELTREHLGSEATEQDLSNYLEAITRIAERDFSGDEEAAEAWLWGSGDYMRRMPEDLI